MNLILLGMVLPWLLLGVGCWLAYQLVRQNGRILLRLETLEAGLKSQLPAVVQPSLGLPIGSAAPDFELPDLSGGRQALAQFRGRPVLLIFFNPQCGFCMQMLPELAGLPSDGKDGRPVPLLVTTGNIEDNRQLMREHGICCPVLLQEQMEVASKYQAGGTPSGYLIDEQGVIASELALGSDTLLTLADSPRSRATEPNGHTAAVNGHPKGPKGKVNRGLHTSRINRDGLKAGTPAPFFRLPRLDGGTLSLEEYRGRRVLLVFSDPSCGPCDQLACQLEQLHRQRPDIQVLMVSRGESQPNRHKVKQHGLTFPVVLQRQWEISRLYGMFSTPIAYLIDAQGVIAADVAVGTAPILALLSGPAVLTNGHPDAPPFGKEVVPMRG